MIYIYIILYIIWYILYIYDICLDVFKAIPKIWWCVCAAGDCPLRRFRRRLSGPACRTRCRKFCQSPTCALLQVAKSKPEDKADHREMVSNSEGCWVLEDSICWSLVVLNHPFIGVLNFDPTAIKARGKQLVFITFSCESCTPCE